MIVNLNVPFSQKDEAKGLGARWNPTKKVWYLNNPEDLTPFLKWIPREWRARYASQISSIKSSFTESSTSETEDAGVLKIWADGSCDPNPGVGGWGWHSSSGESRYGGEEHTTNNRMEMTAILEALRELPDSEKVVIYTDSQYCQKGLTIWRKGWKKKNWMKGGKPMLNRDLWLLLEDQLNRLEVTIKWVKGHNGNFGNEEADRLAGLGVLMASESLPPEIYRF